MLLRKETLSPREAKHTKFALLCALYYLRHGIEIFSDNSDNSLPQDVTNLFWKLKKRNAVKLIFKVSQSDTSVAMKCLSSQLGQIKLYLVWFMMFR